MFRKVLLLLMIAAIGLSGCAPYFQITSKSGTAPTPVISVLKGGVDYPGVFVDPEAFRDALLKALAARETAKLKTWMNEPFLTGTWRADMSETSPVEALASLYAEQLAEGSSLAPVADADLQALMGGTDPLSIPRPEALVTHAFLVSGWGKDGRDEAVLFIATQPDNSLKLAGWMRIQGGFSGARLGGIQPYQNDAQGYSLFLPKGFEAPQPAANQVLILGPGTGHPTENRVGIFISSEPANGRTAEQAAAQVANEAKAQMGAGYTGGSVTAIGIDGEAAYSVGELPGQDVNRQLFIVHNNVLYKMMFVPDSPRAGAYRQMEDAYAMVVNTFHFTH